MIKELLKSFIRTLIRIIVTILVKISLIIRGYPQRLTKIEKKEARQYQVRTNKVSLEHEHDPIACYQCGVYIHEQEECPYLER